MTYRQVLPFLFLLAHGTVVAQQRAIHELRALDAMEPATEKLFHSELVGMDPGAKCSFHEDRVKVMLDNSISSITLVAHLEAAGVGAFAVVRNGDKTACGAYQQKAGTSELPATGPDHLDPAPKQQWAIDHPAQHQEHIRLLRERSPVQHD